MPADSPLRIGPFARTSSLSIKALRSHHEAGLLVPAAIDPVTGYRSYSIAQLTDAAIIRRLRSLDVPLARIHEVLLARDPEVTRKVLAEHAAVLEDRMATMQRAIEELQADVDSPAVHTPVHRRSESAMTALALDATITGDEFEGFLLRTGEALAATARASGAVEAGPFGGCYPTQVDDDVHDVTAFLPVATAPLLDDAARASGIRVGELPATDVAVLVHVGGYDGIEDSYQELGVWVAANAEPTDDPVRERYLVGAGDTDNPAQYRTEICWPVDRLETT